MTVRLRFKTNSGTKPKAARTPVLPRNTNAVTGKEIAAGLASLLSPLAALCVAIAFWRLGQDIGFAREFFITDGPFSHWQVWFAVAGCLIAASTWLNRRGRNDDDSPATS